MKGVRRDRPLRPRHLPCGVGRGLSGGDDLESVMVIVMLILAGLVGFVAYFTALAWEAINGPTLDESVKSGVDAAWADFRKQNLPGIVDGIVRDMIASDPVLKFIKQIQWELARHDPKLAGAEGFETAKQVYIQHLEDEKTRFGDPAFSWDEDGAIALAHAYEIEYWDEN